MWRHAICRDTHYPGIAGKNRQKVCDEDVTGVFDPERLREIIAELSEQLQPIAANSRPKDLKHTLTLVDGTLLKGLPITVLREGARHLSLGSGEEMTGKPKA